MTTYVLGTHASHDGSACLLKDGRVLVAIEKERITRIKHDGGNDNAAVQYCLKAAGITIRDVEVVVQNSNFDMFARRNCGEGRSPRIVDDARRVVTISHHLAHAYSTVCTAPFNDMTCLVIDGCGNSYADCIDKDGAIIPERPPGADLEELYFEKDSYYEFRGGRLRPVYKDFSPLGPRQRYPMFPMTTRHSIGGAYLGVSSYVFRGMEDPGKLMGLAPYGVPGAVSGEMFELRDGRAFLNYDWMTRFDQPARDHSEFKRNFQYYADIAYWAQREIERAILYIVRARYEECPSENLAYSGGVALNAVANRLVKTQTPFRNVYMQPAAGDNGLALGCAAYGWLHVLEGKRELHDRRSNFGRRYPSREIRSALDDAQSQFRYEERPDILEAAADLLAQDKIIGWFQGGSEFGPRALGQRSILSLPRNEAVREFINSKIKFREDFRPFAPSVLAEDAALYFDQEYDSPYMILVAPVHPEWRQRIPAVVHRDGSARVQTVHQEISPRFHALHEAVKRRTGLAVLLNTSLNKRGMPIVETPREALALFAETAMDAMILEDWLVLKKEALASAPDRLDLAAVFARICQGVANDARRPGALGSVHFQITGLEESWTLDLSGVPACRQGTGATADHSVAITANALQRIMRDPSSLLQLWALGEVQVRGPAPPHAMSALGQKIAYLLGHAAER